MRIPGYPAQRKYTEDTSRPEKRQRSFSGTNSGKEHTKCLIVARLNIFYGQPSSEVMVPGMSQKTVIRALEKLSGGSSDNNKQNGTSGIKREDNQTEDVTNGSSC